MARTSLREGIEGQGAQGGGAGRSGSSGNARLCGRLLEEKVSAIIERKRRLMDGVVQHDDPALAKIFTRAELLELLQGV